MHSSGISIWFFIGVLLTAYGALILGYGIYELGTGIMAVQNYHASVWWGGLMLLVGLFYLIRFRPSRTNE
ncbi:MAG: hypothetical protein ABR923_20400 [Terracidiphilus sp.]|jgi:predicted transporter